jgi:hypothetical protein
MTASKPTRTTVSNHEDIVTLRDLVETKLTMLEQMIEASAALSEERNKSLDERLITAEKVLEHRLEGLNALRGNVITKHECKAEMALVGADLTTFRERWAEAKGKASTASVVGVYVVSLIGLILGVISAILQIAR